MVDVRKPLVQTKRVKKKGEEAITVQLKYERLGIFCYYCGLLGHTEDGCNKLFSIDEDNGERQWGPTLRAEQRRRNHEGGGRWLRWEGQSSTWQTPNQERERSINGAFIGRNQNNEGHLGEGDVMEVKKRQDVIANLMKNPHLIKVAAKASISKKEPTLMLQTTKNSIEGAKKDDDDLVVESEKKRMRDGSNKEGTSVTKSIPSATHDMQIDVGEEVIVSDVPHDEQVDKNKNFHFLLAGPGSQACQEK
jgi:hypothetical protein